MDFCVDFSVFDSGFLFAEGGRGLTICSTPDSGSYVFYLLLDRHYASSIAIGTDQASDSESGNLSSSAAAQLTNNGIPATTSDDNL